MSTQRRSRIIGAMAGLGIAALSLAACTGDVEGGGGDADCADYEEYGTFEDASVTISGTILDLEADRLVESWADFAECTGIEIEYQGSSEFEAQIAVLAQGGNATRPRHLPAAGSAGPPGRRRPGSAGAQRGRRRTSRECWDPRTGQDTPPSTAPSTAAPLMASVKGYVWYSPAEVRGERLGDPDHAGGADAICRADHRRDTATSRGASVWSPTRPPAGRAPTGSRTGCCVRRAPMSTTSGSRTRSRSTTRRSSRPSTRVGEVPQERGHGQRRHRRRLDSDQSRPLPDGGPAHPRRLSARCTTRRRSTRPSGTPRAAMRTRSHRTAPSTPSCCRPSTPTTRRRSDRRRRVPGRFPRCRRGRGCPHLPVQ